MKQALSKNNPFSLLVLNQVHPYKIKPSPVYTILFNDETKLVVSLMIQFLVLDTDRYVTELLMSLLFKIDTNPAES